MPKTEESPVILWLASWYPCRLDAFNGDFVQRAAMALSIQLPIQVFYLMKDENGSITQTFLEETTTAGQLTETRLYYHPLKTGIGKLDKLISAWQYTRLGRRWLREFKKKQVPGKPWIVEVCVAMRAGTLALWMKKKWKQPFLVQEHWTGYYRHLMPQDMQRGYLFWKMTSKILREADALLPDSRHLGEWINKTYLPVRFTEIPNTVNTSLFNYNPQGKIQMKFRFIHVSTLGFQKNTDGILRSFKKLMQTNLHAEVELVIVGPGYELHQLWVNQEPDMVQRVIFEGPKPYETVAYLMKTANVLVLFSRYENLPCVMLEAFCCGLPVIATRVGGIEYHLPESHGIIIESENEDQLFNAMKQMVNNYKYYDRHAIAADSRQLYGMETIGKLYKTIYAEIYPQLL